MAQAGDHLGDDHGVSDDVPPSFDDASDTLTATTMEGENGEWEDWDEGFEDTTFVCLFCPASFLTRAAALEHCLQAHSFDYIRVKQDWGLDLYGTVRLVNYIRQHVQEDERADSWEAPAFTSLKADHKLLESERYLRQVMEDDPMLYEIDEDSDFSDSETETQPSKKSAEELQLLLDASDKRARLAEEKVAHLEGVIASYQDLLNRLVLDKEAPATTTTSAPVLTTAPNGVAHEPHAPVTTTSTEATSKELVASDFEDTGVSGGYFSSYAHFGIHMSMLKDAVRTDSYRDMMYLNKDMFKDKIVLDIGCGTGILSMFAARSGAKKVIGVDRSDIVHKAQKIVKKNQLDNVVTIIRGEVEKIELPVPKVDIIISEWMGYFLIYESMLDTVLYARDKWLAPGGIVQPSKLEMLMCAASMEEWYDVYGFNMECMRDSVFREAQIDVVPNEEIISNHATFKTFDISKTKKEEQEFYTTFNLEINQAKDMHAFIGYFDTEFAWPADKHTERVFFSTGPQATPTHWKQTVFLLEKPITGLAKGDVIKGTLTCCRNTEYFRALQMFLDWVVVRDGVAGPSQSQKFHLS